MEGSTPFNGGFEVKKEEMEETNNNKRRVRNSDLCIRLLAFALSLSATLLLGLDKQTKLVPVTLVSTLPPINVPVTAKSKHMSAFTFLVVANAIACSYSIISLLMALGKKRSLTMAIIFLDLLMVGVVASATGAATAVGMIGYKGNSHVRWNKVCNIFNKFCHQVTVAAVLSLFTSISFIFLVMFAVLHLHKKRY